MPAVLITGGSFSEAGGQPAANIAAYDFGTGQWSALGAGIGGGSVYALAVLPTGELVAAGSFSTAGGAPASRVAKWDGATWSPLGAGLSADVMALAVLPNGRLVAGSGYASSGTTVVGFVAQWDGVAWSPLGTFPYAAGQITAARSLLVTSTFELVVGTLANTSARLLRWDGTNWTQATSPLLAHPFPPVASISSLAELGNGTIVAGGGFVPPTGSGISVAQWNGSSWSALGGTGALSGQVGTIVSDGAGTLWIAGLFYGSPPTSSVVRWTGGVVTPLPGLAGGAGSLVRLPNGDLVASGSLDLGGLVSHARWNGASWSPLTASSALDGPVLALLSLPNGDVIAAGDFHAAGAVTLNRIARRSGTQWLPLGSGINTIGGPSHPALAALPNGDILATGLFTSFGDQSIARWNGVAWAPFGFGIYGLGQIPRALAVLPNGHLIVGGVFNNASGTSVNNIARWNGSTWSALGTGVYGPNAYVDAIAALPNGDLVVAGHFSFAGGAAANNIARWNGSAWFPLGAGIGGTSGSDVRALAVMSNGDLIAGGYFSTAGGMTVNHIARWNGSVWSPLGTGIGGVSYPSVSALALLPNGDLLAGGLFSLAGGVPALNLARWNGTSWAAAGTVTTTPAMAGQPEVHALAALPSGEIVVGGWFNLVDGRESRCITRLTSNCLASVAPTGSGCSGSGGSNVLSATNTPWTGSTFRAMASGLGAYSLAVVVLGWQATAIPMTSLTPHAGPGCSLLASPDTTQNGLPVAGVLTTQLAIPNSTALAGVAVHQQVVTVELDQLFSITAITSTNALRLTIGSL